MKKALKILAPLILALAILLTGIITALADIPIYTDDFDLKNPKMNFKLIDTTPREDEEYTATGDFSQTDTETENAKYTISSNTFVAWWANDDIAFAYNQFNIGDTSSDYVEYQMRVHSQKPITSGYTSLPENASVGVMMRDSLMGNASEVFLHVRPGVIMMVFRMMSGDELSQAIYTNIPEQYPVELKLERKGKLFTGYFRKVGDEKWTKVGSCSALFNGPTYAGIATHSCNRNVTTQSVITNVSVKGKGTWTKGDSSSDTSSDSGSSGEEPVTPGPEDPPIDSNILLKETFSDGTLKTPKLNDGVFELKEEAQGSQMVKKRVLTNPVWKNPSSSNIVTLEDGNRVLFKDYADGYDFIGDSKWTDYKASLDVQFTELCNMQTDNKFEFFVRHLSQEMYGCFDYGIRIENYNIVSSSGNIQYDELGNIKREMRIVLVRRQRSTYTGAGGTLVTYPIDNIMGDGKFHNLAVSAIDNCITVEFDGKEVISYADESYISSLTGQIGILTSNTSVYIDNITVEKLDDPLGGDYDNYIGGRFNEPAPDYINDMKIPYYDFTKPNSNGSVERVNE